MSEPVEYVLGDPFHRGILAAEAVGPIGGAGRDDRATPRVGAEHGGTYPVLGKPVVEEYVVGMPLRRSAREDRKALWRAVAVRGDGQSVLDLELAAVAFVADDRVLAAKLRVAPEARADLALGPR